VDIYQIQDFYCGHHIFTKLCVIKSKQTPDDRNKYMTLSDRVCETIFRLSNCNEEVIKYVLLHQSAESLRDITQYFVLCKVIKSS
jgi:hypothetical protein